MRRHRHQVGRASRWHSVRVRHEELWDWCAHQEEIEHHVSERRKLKRSTNASEDLEFQAAH